MVGVGGAYQGEISFIRNGKNDPPIFTLEEVAFVVFIKLPRYDVTAPYQPHAFGRVNAYRVSDNVLDPRAACIYQHPRANGTLWACAWFQCDPPLPVHLLGGDNLGAGVDLCATCLCIAGVQDHQTTVFNPAIGIFVGFFKLLLQRCPFGCAVQLQRRGAFQYLSAP